MSFASQGSSSQRNNDSLLKKKNFFDFHQRIIQKYFFDNGKKRKSHKNLTAQQIRYIRANLELDKRRETGKKVFVLGLSVVLTITLLALIVYVFMEYVF